MAAMMHTVPFQSSVKPKTQKNSTQRRTLVCRAEARDDGAWLKTTGISLMAAGLAATVMISTPAPANAGVVYEQPKLKRSRQFQKSDQPEEPKPESESSGGGFALPSLPSFPSLPSLPAPSLPGLPSLPSPSLPSPSLPTSLPFPSLPEIDTSGGIDFRLVALPASVAGIAAASYAAYSYDSGFRSMIREGLVKDSTDYAGYEEEVATYRSNGGKGTRRIGAKPAKKTAKKAKNTGKRKGETKKGGGFGLFT